MKRAWLGVFAALACAAILSAPAVRAQGYQFLQRNCPSCVVVFSSLSASTVTASASIQTPSILGAGGAQRIALPSNNTDTITSTAPSTGSAAGHILNTSSSYVSGDNLLLVQNFGTNEFFFGALGGFTAAGAVASSSTTTPQFKCTGAATCLFQSASGQNTSVDTAGASTVNVGTGNATTVILGRSGQTTNVNGNVQVGTKVTKYNNVALAGMGLSPIYAYGTLAASTASGATVTTFTPAAQGVFEVGGHVAATAFTSGFVGLRLAYTDCQGNAQSYVMVGESVATAGTASSLTATGLLAIYSQTICANAASITLQTSNTGTATASYWAWLKQVN